MNDIIETDSISYENGFKKICARFMDKEWTKDRFQTYNNLLSIVTELAKKVSDATILADDLTLESNSVSNQSLGAKSISSQEEKCNARNEPHKG